MTLSEIVNAAGRRTNKTTTNSDVRNKFIEHVNAIREIAWTKYDWSWKKRVWWLRTYDQVTSGTMTVTNGSSTVTNSGTPFSSTHAGWYLRILGSTPESWYRVINVPSSSTLTLDPAYQGSTASGVSYELRKVDYLLPSELEGMPTVVETENRVLTLNPPLFTRPFGIPDTRGKPTHGIVWSDDPIGSTYTTGTISGTADTRTVTGSSTAWLANVTPGDQLEVVVGSATYKYTVRSVESDTSLTLYQFLRVDISSGTSYTIRNQFGRILRLTPTADDEYPIAVHGTRRFYPLQHDDDIDELLAWHSEAIITGVIALEQGATPDDRENPQFVKFLSLLSTAAAADARNMHANHPAPIQVSWGAYRA